MIALALACGLALGWLLGRVPKHDGIRIYERWLSRDQAFIDDVAVAIKRAAQRRKA